MQNGRIVYICLFINFKQQIVSTCQSKKGALKQKNELKCPGYTSDNLVSGNFYSQILLKRKNFAFTCKPGNGYYLAGDSVVFFEDEPTVSAILYSLTVNF